MIPCQHKGVIFSTNLGCMVEDCSQVGMFVDDIVCGKCAMREGENYVPDITVPGRRTEEEIQEITEVCKGCPLFNHDTARCPKIMSPVPVSSLAQNRMLRCPEKKW